MTSSRSFGTTQEQSRIAERDFQTGEARAVASEQVGSEFQQELAAVLSAGDAKTLAQEIVARTWIGRDKLTLHLPPSQLALEPGSKLTLALNPTVWAVQKATVDGFAIIAELRPSNTGGVAVSADAGRFVPNVDIVRGPITLALFDVPNVLALSSTSPMVLLAASTATPTWKRNPVEINYGGQSVGTFAATRRSVLGRSVSMLKAGTTELIDRENSVKIALVDPDQWLTSCDDDALAAGNNLAVLGHELIQFGRADPLGGGQFRLSYLLRGRGGSEWACAEHAIDDVFGLIQAGTVQPVEVPTWCMGATVTATTAGGPAVSIEFGAEGLRPLTPVNLSAELQPSGELWLSWTRRSRQGFAWLDQIDAPLGETSERYRVIITGSVDSLEVFAEQPAATVIPSDLASLGEGAASIQVQQIGDFAASRPAQLIIILP